MYKYSVATASIYYGFDHFFGYFSLFGKVLVLIKYHETIQILIFDFPKQLKYLFLVPRNRWIIDVIMSMGQEQTIYDSMVSWDNIKR